jgi:cytochrome oxidase assembly protein ShyY1
MKPHAEWHPVRLHGSYLPDEQVLVRNRPHGGTSAFEVLVPFRNEDGRIIVVDRGWVPPGNGDSPDAVPAPPTGSVDVIVRLRPGEQLPTSGRSAPDGQVPTIHLPTVAAAVTGDVVVSAYGQLSEESPAPDTALGAFEAPTEDPGPHLSYAIQWILFAVMGFVFIFYMIRTEVHKHREEAAGRPATAPQPRRRDRDAAIEDELLDEVDSRR